MRMYKVNKVCKNALFLPTQKNYGTKLLFYKWDLVKGGINLVLSLIGQRCAWQNMCSGTDCHILRCSPLTRLFTASLATALVIPQADSVHWEKTGPSLLTFSLPYIPQCLRTQLNITVFLDRACRRHESTFPYQL